MSQLDSELAQGVPREHLQQTLYADWVARRRTVLFATAGFWRKPHADGMRIVGLIGDLVGGALMALAVPIAVLAVGVPIALVVRIVLSAFGLL